MKFKKGDKVRVMGTKTVYIVVEKYADSIDLVRLIDDDSGMHLGFREGVLELAEVLA